MNAEKESASAEEKRKAPSGRKISGKGSFFKNMKVKRKLLIVNIMMLVIPILVAVGIFGVFFNGVGSSYWEIMENVFRDDNGIYSAQSLLRSCTDESHLDEASSEMAKAGYHFSVVRDGEVWYSNLTDADLAAGEQLSGSVSSTDSNYTVSSGENVVISSHFQEEGHEYTVTAVRTADTAQSTDTSSVPYIKRYIEWFLGIMVVILLAVVFILNFLTSRWITRSILKPLNQLSEGSARIRSGDLDFDMVSDRKDEIGTVINDFNDMRGHLQESVDERMRYENYRQEMIRGISHDLRTPLTSIKGYVDGLRDGIADTPEKKEKYYNAIETSVANLEHLTDDLTDLSALESGMWHVHVGPVELNEYYRSCVADLGSRYAECGIDIHLNESQKPLHVRLDTGEMDRVHCNLLNNTIKYREKERSNITVTLSGQDDKAVIRIADDGPGVKEEDLPRVFECFYRGDASRSNPGSGSGIGLSVVKQIIAEHGGTVTAESNDGFTVVITLPVADETDSGQEETETE